VGGTAEPTSSPTETSTTGANPSATPGAAVAPTTCTSVSPVRVEKVDKAPPRTTEVVTVVSDGKNVTSGTREQTDFLTPTLLSPDSTQITDQATTKRIASLIAAAGKDRVLFTRPEAPDTGANVSRRPFSAPGTYVLFNASSVLNATVIVACGEQQQRWSFTAEADPSSGQINCAVAPTKSNSLARLVYADNC
jgi:hypothetical protein